MSDLSKEELQKLIAMSIPKPSPHDGTAQVGDTSPNNLSWWFPKLVDAELPVPQTRFVSMGNWYSVGDGFYDGKDSTVLRQLISMMQAFGDELGWPCFIRTGYFSGKHRWKECCYVESAEQMGSHMAAIAEMQEVVNVMERDKLSTWVVRELLPTTTLITCQGYGDFPVTREFRFFVDGTDVRYHVPYWPEDAVAQGTPYSRGWKPVYDEMCVLEGEELEELTDLASRAGDAMGHGRWSVDLLMTTNGWFITDMALAERSYGYDPEKFQA